MRTLLPFLFAVCAAAQVTTGSISGFVFDPAGRPIARAALAVVDQRYLLRRTSYTNDQGFYSVVELPPASYSVTSSSAGLADSAVNVDVTVESHRRIDFHLKIAGKKESVTVAATVRALETESPELGTTLDQHHIENLPLNQRDFLQLALLTPGVLPPVQNSELSTRGSFAMHTNGAREAFNNFLLDGVDNNDQDTNRYVLQPPVDAIQEFKIATNSYSAEYGRNAGGQVNVITRSGANDWHGFLYEYLRNRDLDARNFFDAKDRPEYVRSQFGAGIGGPIVKNRSFFFGDFDGLRADQGLSGLAIVPSAAEREGDLSAILAMISDPFSRVPYPENRIPRSRVSPLAKDYVDLFPLPNRPGPENYLAQPVLRDQEWQANLRLDQRLSSVDQLSVRYSYGNKDLFEPFAENSTQVPGFGDFLKDRGHNAMIHYVRTLGPRALNSLLAGLNRGTRRLLQQNYTQDINKLWDVSYLPGRPIDFGFPAVSVAGFSQVGDITSLPIDRAETTYQVSDDLSLIRDNHILKAGVQIRRLQLNGIVDVLTRGSVSFSGALSGSGLSDLLLGLPTLGIQSQANNVQTLRSSSIDFYEQDDWKINPSLTLNIGLRYEYNTPATDPTNRMGVFDLRTQQIVPVGTNGISRSGIRPDRGDFAPRFGFAWSPARTLVVRGGYGIYYDAGILEVNSSLYFNPPYFGIFVYFPTDRGPLTIANPFPSNAGFRPPPSLNTLSSNLTTGYIQQWNLNLQKQVPHMGSVSLAYAGSKGTHLIRSLDLNQPTAGPGDLQSRRLYPNFSNIFFIESGANSNFHSVQASLDRPVGGSLSLLASYMMSKSIDDTSAFLGTQSDPNFPQNSRDYRAERSVSSFDIHSRLTAACVYRLPGRNWWNRNTDSSAIVVAQTGQPFTPTLRFDNSHTGNTGGSFGSDRPDLLGNPRLSERGPDEWFNTSAFGVPPPYTFGSAGRNILRGPGLVSFDMSLARQFSVREWGSLRFEAQAFNLFNHTNFDLPQAFADDPASFGKIFSAKSPRQIQFALRFAF